MEPMNYWIVKLGKVYYACGVSRFSEGFNDACSYEMTTEEMVAWPFKHVEVAVRIAEMIGGTVIEKKGDVNLYISHAEQNLDYLESGADLEDEPALKPRRRRSWVNRNGIRYYTD